MEIGYVKETAYKAYKMAWKWYCGITLNTIRSLAATYQLYLIILRR